MMRTLKVVPKTRIGAPDVRTDGFAHYIKDVWGTARDDYPRDDYSRIGYQAQWLCGGRASVVTLLFVDHDRKMCVHCLDRVQPSVYRGFDADGALLYVGSTVTRTRRIRQHERDTPWWPLVASVEFEAFPTYEDAYRAEAVAITSESPRYNRAGRSREARAA